MTHHGVQPCFWRAYTEVHISHNDVIIETESLHHHHNIVNLILVASQRLGLTLNAKKCLFAK